MREVKVFRASVDPDEEPYPFRLEFENTRTKEVTAHEFNAQANPGAGADLTVSSIARYVGDRRFVDLTGVMRFYKRVLLDDGYERLQALVDDQSVTIEYEMLAAPMNWLIEEYSGRPTGGSQPS